MRNSTLAGLILGLLTISLGLWAPPASAQPMGFGDDVSVSGQAWWSLQQAEEGPLVALVAITMDHAPGLKTWPSKEQDALPAAVDAMAIHTELALSVGSGVIRAGAIQWPEPKPYPVPDVANPGGTIEVPVYSGRAVLFVPVLIEREAAAEARTLELVVSYQACDETVCYPPADAEVLASLPAHGEGEAPATAAGVDSMTIDNAIALAVLTARGEAPEPVADAGAQERPAGGGEPAAAADTRNKFLGFITVPSPDSAGGIAFIVLMGIVGGFVLNLTPCVLPVIPIKVMTLSQHAGSPGKTLMLGLWMALGVVAFWVGLGIPAAVLSTAVGAIFGIWWFTAGVGVIIAIMSLGLMGLFTIQLPQSVYKVNPKADSPWGSFVFGVMTGVLGLPCFGLVAGALLASSAAMPPAVTMLIFTALGIGMALPYVILSLNPKWVDVLPRTGPASELVKQVMGLLLLGAGAYFVATGLQALTKAMPWIAGQLQWWAAAIFIALACLWLAWRTIQITPSMVRRASFVTVALLGGAFSLWFAYSATETARQQHLDPVWVAYTPEVLADARSSGSVVVVEFTADWCLNCKALESAVLNRDPVDSRLRDDDVVAIKVDLTHASLPGWDLMRELNQKAPPVLAVYGPGIEGDTPWMANTYTSGSVMDAIALGKGTIETVRGGGTAGVGGADKEEIARAN